MAIDRKNGVPIYVQIEQWLRLGITQGTWKVDGYLPTEDELCRMFGISRGPVRQALERLVNDGIVVRERRKGTRVVRLETNLGLVLVTPFRSIAMSNMKPSVRVLQLDLVEAPRHVAERWGLKAGDQVVCFERIFLGDDRPMAYGISYLPGDRFASLVDHNMTEQALVDVLSRDYGVVITRLEETMEVKMISAPYSKLLQVAPESSCLQVVIWQWAGRQPVERGEFYLLQPRFLIATYPFWGNDHVDVRHAPMK